MANPPVHFLLGYKFRKKYIHTLFRILHGIVCIDR